MPTPEITNQNYHWQIVDFQPTDPAAIETVRAGDIGAVQSVRVEGEQLIIVTDKGQFTLARPQLDPPAPDALNGNQAGDTNGRLGEYSLHALTDIYEIMALLHKVSREQKAAAAEGRMLNHEAQFEALLNAADKIRDAAYFALAAGIVTGAAQIGGGLFSIKGGGAGLKDPANSVALGSIGQGQSSVVQGIGTGIASLLNFGGSMMQAEQKELEARATQAEQYAQAETEFIQSNAEQLRLIQEKLQAIEQAHNDTIREILRG